MVGTVGRHASKLFLEFFLSLSQVPVHLFEFFFAVKKDFHGELPKTARPMLALSLPLKTVYSKVKSQDVNWTSSQVS